MKRILILSAVAALCLLSCKNSPRETDAPAAPASSNKGLSEEEMNRYLDSLPEVSDSLTTDTVDDPEPLE